MLIFFDTEMTDLCADRKLISIGFVSEDGKREFYAELSDTYQLSDCSDFVREAVLPNLQGGDALMTMRDLSMRLVEWLLAFDERVQFATDSFEWDWPWINFLFGDFGTYLLETSPYWEELENRDTPGRFAGVGQPANVDSTPFLLQQTDAFKVAVEKAFENDLRRHHALDDAKASRLGWLDTINKGSL